jgi:hypothetical protein
MQPSKKATLANQGHPRMIKGGNKPIAPYMSKDHPVSPSTGKNKEAK